MENELKHYGILGMKWGVRRYQNPDGTLTAAGKKRYNEDGSKKSIKTRYLGATQIAANIAINKMS